MEEFNLPFKSEIKTGLRITVLQVAFEINIKK